MPKLPVDLTVAEWKKAKPLLLKDPGLDKKLAAWETAKKESDTTPSYDVFKKCGTTLKEVVDTAKVAQAACNKTLHKDAIAFLGGYIKAVANVSQGLQKKGEEYSKRVMAWGKKRVDCLAGMQKVDAECNTLKDKFGAVQKTCESSAKSGQNIKNSVGLANSFLKEVKTFRQKAQDIIDIVRIDDPSTRCNVNDRDQKFVDMFSASIKLQSGMEGDCLRMINYLEGYAKTHKV